MRFGSALGATPRVSATRARSVSVAEIQEWLTEAAKTNTNLRSNGHRAPLTASMYRRLILSVEAGNSVNDIAKGLGLGASKLKCALARLPDHLKPRKPA